MTGKAGVLSWFLELCLHCWKTSRGLNFCWSLSPSSSCSPGADPPLLRYGACPDETEMGPYPALSTLLGPQLAPKFGQDMLPLRASVSVSVCKVIS